MKRKVDIEDKIVFLSNTLGSFVLGVHFGSLKTITGTILGAYCLLNIFCYLTVFSENYKGNDKK